MVENNKDKEKYHKRKAVNCLKCKQKGKVYC